MSELGNYETDLYWSSKPEGSLQPNSRKKEPPVRLSAGWRWNWASNTRYNGYEEYAQERGIFGSRVTEITERTQKMEEKGDHRVENWIRTIKDAHQIYLEASNSEQNFDSEKRISEAFTMNEVFVPVLTKVERIFTNESEESKKELVAQLSKFAVDACKNEKTEEEDPYANPFTLETIISMVKIGGTEGVRQMRGFFEEVRELDKNIFNKGGKRDRHRMVVDDPEGLKFVHAVLTDEIQNIKWSDTEAETVAGSLSEFMPLLPSLAESRWLNNYKNVFQGLGLDNAVPILLENLRNKESATRQISAEILYRLEMGKVGITDRDGVRYFDKIYKLIRENDPDFFVKLYSEGGAFVQRIDNHGRIGVFNAEKKLLGSFNLDLSLNNREVEAMVKDMASKEVFVPKADETAEERKSREAMTEIFLARYEEMSDVLHRETGVRLNSLELYEQGWFVLSYQEANGLQKKRLLNAIKDYGELGLKSFLAADYGGTGEDILQYLESPSSSKELKQEVLENFFLITNKAFEWRKTFEVIEGGMGRHFAAEVHEAFLRKSCEFFKAAMLIDKGEGGDVTIEKLREAMRAVTYSLEVLKGLSDEKILLKTESVDSHDGYLDEKMEILSKEVRKTWVLKDEATGSRLVVTVRPERTYAESDGSKGEGRINLKVVNKDEGVEMRMAFDMSTFATERGLAEEPRVSLDLGVGESFYRSGVYPTARLGEVLSLVERSEGGHNEASFSADSSRQFGEVANTFKKYLSRRFVTA